MPFLHINKMYTYMIKERYVRPQRKRGKSVWMIVMNVMFVVSDVKHHHNRLLIYSCKITLPTQFSYIFDSALAYFVAVFGVQKVLCSFSVSQRRLTVATLNPLFVFLSSWSLFVYILQLDMFIYIILYHILLLLFHY